MAHNIIYVIFVKRALDNQKSIALFKTNILHNLRYVISQTIQGIFLFVIDNMRIQVRYLSASMSQLVADQNL